MDKRSWEQNRQMFILCDLRKHHKEQIIFLNLYQQLPLMHVETSAQDLLETAECLRNTGQLTRPQPSKPGTSTQKKIGSYCYETTNEIGRGYSSIVYKGTNTRTNQECAIKVVDLQDCSDSTLKMQEMQIKILRTLDHPNIIKCYDIYRTNNHCYIITEYCKHGDLFSFLAKHNQVQQVAAIAIMNQIISGIKYLMKKNIIHRDLKPANILKSETGWKIADFGFAVISSTHLKSKHNVGTPLYMPLQSLVDNVYSHKSDIFAVGIIFYQLLTGTTPWECRLQKELIKKLKTIPYSFPEKMAVSNETKQLLQNLCAIVYEQRLSKEEFMSLNIAFLNVNHGETLAVKALGKQTQIREFKSKQQRQTLKMNKSATNLFLKEKSEVSIDSRIQTKNNHILVNQLHYCRFIFYFIRNIKHLRVGSKNKIKLALVLFRHLQKLIFLLSNKKDNYFKLPYWDAFKCSKKYLSTHLTMKEYSSRYAKEAITYIKEVDPSFLQQVDNAFHSLTFQETFTAKCYSEIMTFVSALLREANHNLTIETKDIQELSPSMKAGIESLKTLLKYYKLVHLSSTQFQKYDVFEMKSNIRVIIDYNGSSCTLNDYAELRDQLKFI